MESFKQDLFSTTLELNKASYKQNKNPFSFRPNDGNTYFPTLTTAFDIIKQYPTLSSQSKLKLLAPLWIKEANQKNLIKINECSE